MKKFYKTGNPLPLKTNNLNHKYSYSSDYQLLNVVELANDTKKGNSYNESENLESYAKYLERIIYEIQIRKYHDNELNPIKSKKQILSWETKLMLYTSRLLDLEQLRGNFISLYLLFFILLNTLFTNAAFSQNIEFESVKEINFEKAIVNLLTNKELTAEEVSRIQSFYPGADLEKYPYQKILIDTNFMPTLKIGSKIPEQFLNHPIRLAVPEDGNDSTTIRALLNKKWLILNGWADWCAPCKKSIEIWENIYSDYKEDITVVGLHLDFDYKAPLVIQRMNWTLPHIIGGEAFALSRFFLGQTLAGPSIIIHNGAFFGVVSVKPKDKENIIHLLEGRYDHYGEHLKWLVKPLFMKGGKENEL